MMKTRLQDGSTIIEVSEHPQDEGVLLTVSKARYDEDAVQVRISRHMAGALGLLLVACQP